MPSADRNERHEEAVKQQLQPAVKEHTPTPPADLQRRLGVFDAMAAMSDLCKLNGIRLLQELKTWCLDNRVSWEQFCEEHLPKCRRQIDRYLGTLDTFGDGSYEGVVALTTQAELIEARRLYKAGKIRQEGNEVVIGRKRILNDAEHTYQIVEALREAFARAEAAEAGEKEKDTELTQVREAGKKIMANQQDLIQRQKTELDRIRARPTPIHGATEADRQQFPHLHTIAIEIDLDLDRLEGLTLEEGHATGFWRELGNRIRQIHDRVHDVASRLSDEHPEAFDAIWDEVRLGAALPPGERPEPVPLAEQAERMLIDAAIPHNHDA